MTPKRVKYPDYWVKFEDGNKDYFKEKKPRIHGNSLRFKSDVQGVDYVVAFSGDTNNVHTLIKRGGEEESQRFYDDIKKKRTRH